MITRDDFERTPCTCPACYQAGVSGRLQLRSPQTGAFLHGEDLRRLYVAKDAFWASAAAHKTHRWPATTGYQAKLTIHQRLEAIFAPPRDVGEEG